MFTEVVSLGLVQPPGAMGADIVVGEGQSIGNALSFGGPYVGLFATRSKLIRQMPGRLCGAMPCLHLETIISKIPSRS